eukprot:1487-Heterococcus_DN1.PRE.1
MQQLQWSLYAVALSTFHFMEFFSTALFKPDTVSYDSYCSLMHVSQAMTSCSTLHTQTPDACTLAKAQ